MASSSYHELAAPAYEEESQHDQPALDITTAFNNLRLEDSSRTPGALPTPDQCIAHLKVLEAFHQLKENISYTDGLFGLEDFSIPTSFAASDIQELKDRLAQKRWAVYLARAVDRFSKWWTLALPQSQYFQIQQLGWDDPYDDILRNPVRESQVFTQDNIPPVGMSSPVELRKHLLTRI